jgi:hypothetical protein
LIYTAANKERKKLPASFTDQTFPISNEGRLLHHQAFSFICMRRFCSKTETTLMVTGAKIRPETPRLKE